MEKNNTVRQAGGFIIQLMPFASDEVIDRLEQNLMDFPSVTAVLDSGATPEEMLELLFKDLDLEIHETIPTKFHCNCDKKRVEKALISIGKKDLDELISDDKEIEVKCHFCNTAYQFNVDELKTMRSKSRAEKK